MGSALTAGAAMVGAGAVAGGMSAAKGAGGAAAGATGLAKALSAGVNSGLDLGKSGTALAAHSLGQVGAHGLGMASGAIGDAVGGVRTNFAQSVDKSAGSKIASSIEATRGGSVSGIPVPQASASNAAAAPSRLERQAHQTAGAAARDRRKQVPQAARLRRRHCQKPLRTQQNPAYRASRTAFRAQRQGQARSSRRPHRSYHNRGRQLLLHRAAHRAGQAPRRFPQARPHRARLHPTQPRRADQAYRRRVRAVRRMHLRQSARRPVLAVSVAQLRVRPRMHLREERAVRLSLRVYPFVNDAGLACS
ncbi:hypothetical protein BUMB_02029 [Candidatus Paraburkholderia calva]|nr:hypothetical protein BUMB_02029 [Candidatus Paraburkholderia calva]